MTHFRCSSFPKCPIFEVTLFLQLTQFWSVSFPRLIFSEVTNFRSNSFTKWHIFPIDPVLKCLTSKFTDFRDRSFLKWSIFEVTHFRIGPFSKLTHFRSYEFSKWHIFSLGALWKWAISISLIFLIELIYKSLTQNKTNDLR